MKTTLDLPDDVLTEGLRRVTSSASAGGEAAQRDRSARLIQALQGLGSEGPITPMKREEIYDRKVLR